MAVAPRHLKVTKEQYFEEALDCLAQRGADGMAVGSLCSSLGVTTGSFYHYFGGWSGFVDALLAHWESSQTHRIGARMADEATPGRRLELLQKEVLRLPHEAEAAIRAWGRSEDKVRLALERVDAQRISVVHGIAVDLGVPDRNAKKLASMALALLIGVQQMRTPVDGRLLRSLLNEHARTLNSYTRPTAEPTNRFSSRSPAKSPNAPS